MYLLRIVSNINDISLHFFYWTCCRSLYSIRDPYKNNKNFTKIDWLTSVDTRYISAHEVEKSTQLWDFSVAQLCMGGVFVEFSRDNSSYLAIRGPIVNVIGQRDKNIVPQEVHAMRGESVRCTLTIRPPHRLRLPCKRHEKLFCWSTRGQKFTEHRSYRCQIIEIRPQFNSTSSSLRYFPQIFCHRMFQASPWKFPVFTLFPMFTRSGNK